MKKRRSGHWQMLFRPSWRQVAELVRPVIRCRYTTRRWTKYVCRTRYSSVYTVLYRVDQTPKQSVIQFAVGDSELLQLAPCRRNTKIPCSASHAALSTAVVLLRVSIVPRCFLPSLHSMARAVFRGHHDARSAFSLFPTVSVAPVRCLPSHLTDEDFCVWC